MFQRALEVFRKNFQEFKDFAFKGNLIQLAIGVVLGGAFGGLIKSFVENIFMPLLSVFGAQGSGVPGYARWEVRGIHFGQFIADLIGFLIVALAIFLLMVKVVGWIARLSKGSKDTAPTEKDCPYCLMKIPVKAIKCAHCTADLHQQETPAPLPVTPA
jgi:large conductance mechanosensitive channel